MTATGDVGRARWGLSMALGGELAEPAEIAEIAAAAEAAGWDGVFVWDHLWHRDGSPFADPFVTLAAAACATTTVALGPLVTPLPRRRPQVVAQQATTLDRLSNGRLVLGLGLGHDRYEEYSAFPWGRPEAPSPADARGSQGGDERARAAQLDAGIEFLLPALAGDDVAAAGGRRTTVAARRRPRCPIWVAGSVDRRAGPRRALRYRLDGVAVVGGGAWAVDHVRTVRAHLGAEGDAIDVALVGGSFPDPPALGRAGATWLIPEILPGTPAADARAVAAAGPRG